MFILCVSIHEQEHIYKEDYRHKTEKGIYIYIYYLDYPHAVGEPL